MSKPVSLTPKRLVPVRVEVFIEPDGSVTFADLAAELIPIAAALDPDLAEKTEAQQEAET